MVKSKVLHKSEAWLKMRRVMQKKTLAEMADEAGVSIEMISRSLKKAGIR